MYLTMEGAKNSSVLQQDLDQLSVWESDWDMEFNPSKCQVVQVAGSRKPEVPLMCCMVWPWRLLPVLGILGWTSPAICPGAHT